MKTPKPTKLGLLKENVLNPKLELLLITFLINYFKKIIKINLSISIDFCRPWKLQNCYLSQAKAKSKRWWWWWCSTQTV